MHIEYTNPKVKLTNEEKYILKQAKDILMLFEDECTSKDENVVQELYEDYTYCVERQTALSTTIDLLTVIVGDTDNEV